MLKTLKKKYHSDVATNEMVGLISGKCVCRGYAGIVRDVCTSIGLETKIIIGVSQIHGHAWNQAKLDGKWYNVDLTWDHNQILKKQDTYWLLKSDDDFEKFRIKTYNFTVGHKDYSENRTTSNICTESVSANKLNEYLYLEDNKKRQWLSNLIINLSLKNKGGMGR